MGAPGARLRSDVRANLVGNVVYAAGLWAQLVLLARLGGAAAVGAYALALALVQPPMLFSQLQLRTLLASDVRGTWSFREYRALRAATTAAAVASIAPLALATGQWRTVWPFLGPVCLKAAADALADVYLGLWQQHERMGLGAWVLSLNAIGSVSFMAIAATAGASPPAMAAGAALGSCLALAFVHARTSSDGELGGELRGRTPLEWRRLALLAREAAPLGAIVLLGSLQSNVPRYAIQRTAGTVALGLFAAAWQLTSAGTLVVQAIGGAAAPRLARACATREASAFGRLTRTLVLSAAALGIAGVAAATLAGRPVLTAVFGREFGAAAGILVVLSAAAGIGFVATLLGYALTAARVLALQAGVLSVTLAVTAATSVLLVPLQGAAGGAWALAAAALVQAAWSAAALRKFRQSFTLRERAPGWGAPP